MQNVRKFYKEHKKEIITAYRTKYADRTNDQQDLIRNFSDMYMEHFGHRPAYKKDLEILEKKKPKQMEMEH